jgi:hypothetical protein
MVVVWLTWRNKDEVGLLGRKGTHLPGQERVDPGRDEGAEVQRPQPGVQPRQPRRHRPPRELELHLGFGRIVVLDIETPILSVNLL